MPSVYKPGILYIVATPIGNLEDITLRALRILKEVDLIAAEDTRQTRRLLSYYGIKTPLLSYREENRIRQGEKLIHLLREGKDVALVSDAGTPCISDPGVHLVTLAAQAGIKIVPIPGPSAIITALSVAGVSTHPFIFVGFLPQRKGRRRKLLLSFQDIPYTIIFYESPHRFKKTMELIAEIFPERETVVARELTKLHEEIMRGRAKEILNRYEEREVKGEITVILAGKQKN